MSHANSSRALIGAFVIGLAAARFAEAQSAVFNVKVTVEAGGPIVGANVYINDLSISAITDSNGNTTLTAPADRGNARVINLRVRAVGYAPQARVVSLAAGTSRVLFELKRDSSRAEDVVRAMDGYERARVLAMAQGQNMPAQADPFARFLFTPELVMQHQDAIALQESQRATLQAAIQEAQAQVTKMQWALALDSEKLTKVLNSTMIDEKEVLAQVDRILMIEREIKRAQMTLMIRIKNTLTPTQQARLRQLRG